MLLILIHIIIFFLFVLLIMNMIKNGKVHELFIVFLAVITVTIGEAMNLFIYKMAVYHGVYGIPLYIILGGAMVAWGIYKLVTRVSVKFNVECIFCRFFILLLLSLFLPLIEVVGLKTGLWYWQRPYSILSFSWFLGVWKFYLIFIVSPAVIGLFLDLFKVNNHSCSCKIT